MKKLVVSRKLIVNGLLVFLLVCILSGFRLDGPAIHPNYSWEYPNGSQWWASWHTLGYTFVIRYDQKDGLEYAHPTYLKYWGGRDEIGRDINCHVIWWQYYDTMHYISWCDDGSRHIQ